MSKVIGWKIKDFDKYFFKTAKRHPHETLSLQQYAGDAESAGTAEVADAIPGPQDTPSQIILEREGLQMFERAMTKLPERYREVIKYRQILKLSAADTAEKMGIRANAVNVLYHRAQQRLHQILRDSTYFSES